MLTRNKYYQWLALGGLLVGLTLGIIKLATSPDWVIWSFLGAIGLVGLSLYLYWRDNSAYDYKFITQRIQLKILDDTGRRAQYMMTGEVECLRQHSRTMNYRISVTGEAKNFEEKSGVIENIYKEGTITYIQTSFKKVFKKGKQVSRHLTCDMIDTFDDDRNWWTSSRLYPAENLQIVVLLPTSRAAKAVWGFEEVSHKKKELKNQPRLEIDGGFQIITWDIKKPSLHRKYRIEWEW